MLVSVLAATVERGTPADKCIAQLDRIKRVTFPSFSTALHKIFMHSLAQVSKLYRDGLDKIRKHFLYQSDWCLIVMG